MKLTKSQLKQVIKEELEVVLNETLPWPGQSGTLHHGIEWFDKQPSNSQRKMFDSFRSQGGRVTSEDGPEKQQWNDWLWKWHVPTDVKQGRG